MRICDRLVPATPGESSSPPDWQTTFWPPSAANGDSRCQGAVSPAPWPSRLSRNYRSGGRVGARAGGIEEPRAGASGPALLAAATPSSISGRITKRGSPRAREAPPTPQASGFASPWASRPLAQFEPFALGRVGARVVGIGEPRASSVLGRVLRARAAPSSISGGDRGERLLGERAASRPSRQVAQFRPVAAGIAGARAPSGPRCCAPVASESHAPRARAVFAAASPHGCSRASGVTGLAAGVAYVHGRAARRGWPVPARARARSRRRARVAFDPHSMRPRRDAVDHGLDHDGGSHHSARSVTGSLGTRSGLSARTKTAEAQRYVPGSTASSRRSL